jgi:hypothetical protein
LVVARDGLPAKIRRMTKYRVRSRLHMSASLFSVYVTKCIADSDVCGAGPQLDATLTDAVVKSFLDGAIFTNVLSLCKPLAALDAGPTTSLSDSPRMAASRPTRPWSA